VLRKSGVDKPDPTKSMTQTMKHSSYRSDVDGLRAIAVLSVVGFHAFPGKFASGFVGVDIFFVISGFLISSIIFTNLELEQFSLLDFYSRRIRRIFPALITVLVASLAFGWFVLLADEFKQLGKQIAGGAGFVSNFILWGGNGYFDSLAATKPLLHLWSLAIEEQFYVLWPLLLILVWKRKWNFLGVTLFVASFSFAANIYLVGRDPVATFYSPVTRFWELMSGSTLAYISIHRQELISRYRNIQSLFGFCLLAIGFVQINETRAFPGWWALLPIFGAFFIISAGPKAWLNQFILSNRVFVWIGLISYPLYLWHWPLLSFAHIIENAEPSRSIRAAACIVSVALAWATYRLIEKPLRLGRNGQRKTMALLLTMIAVGSIGYFIFASDGLVNRKIALLTVELSRARVDSIDASIDFSDGRINFGSSRLNGLRPDTVLFIGDSLMNQYYPRAAKIYSDQTNLPYLSALFVARPGCRPVPNGVDINSNGRNCDEFYKAILALARDPIYKRIVVSANWELVFSEPAFSKNNAQLLLDFGYLRNLGKEIIIISLAPHSASLNPLSLAKPLRLNFFSNKASIPADQWINRSEVERYQDASWRRLVTFADAIGATLVDPFNFLCSQTMCPAILNHEPLYTDDYHLRGSAVERYATFIDSFVVKP
jgi:peptidoglycan/LPS O-acetylase OafA/YrhL